MKSQYFTWNERDSKAALACWTRYLAKEFAPRKIRVNAVSPGPVHTNFSDGAFDKHPEFIQPLAEQIALGRIGNPQDVARVIVNLLSDDFGWVTDQDIDVSGGFCFKPGLFLIASDDHGPSSSLRRRKLRQFGITQDGANFFVEKKSKRRGRETNPQKRDNS